MGALSNRNDEPERASRPFDVDRDGFVMGEGAGFLVLEDWDRAVGRGAHIYGEVAGYGRNSDAYHVTAPAPGGAGAAHCMRLALADAGLEPADIGHINAHGTSTDLNDAAEAEAVVKVFGENALPVTSAKGVIGHLIAAAGAVEAVASMLAMRDGLVPPTANPQRAEPELGLDVVAGEARVAPPTPNHQRAEPELGIDVVAGEPRRLAAAPVVSNSFGFGGHNASLVLTPYTKGE